MAGRRNNQSVMRFEKDRWTNILMADVKIGDVIYVNNQLIEVLDSPVEENGKLRLDVRLAKSDDEPIVLALGKEWNDRQATVAVMDFTGSGCRDFGDGTYMIAELEEGPGAIYSPRLSIKELEDWCANHLDRFVAFFESNELALDRGDVVRMTPWWLT